MATCDLEVGHRTCSQKVRKVLRANLLIILLFFAIIIGVVLGIGLRDTWYTHDKRNIHFLRFPGDLLMNMLKMLIIPLIVSSLISSLASLDAKASGKMGIRAVVYYLTTTLVAVTLGIILVLTIQPGTKGKTTTDTKESKKGHPADALMDLIRNCFPDNLVTACFQRQVTIVNVTEVKNNIAGCNITTNTTAPPTCLVDDPMITIESGSNILGLLVFSIFFGRIIRGMGVRGKPLAEFFEGLHVASMRLVTLVIWYSPIGIIFLLASKLVEMDDPAVVFEQLGYYMATVLAGLAIHAFILLPLLYFVIVRKNPYKFMHNMLKALLTAWGTASSSATLPVTMECLEDNNHVDIRVIKFIAPMGATINMDGTSLYKAVASIFIAQHFEIELSTADVIVISLTSIAAAIGAPGVPQAGLVTMGIILTAVGIPNDHIAVIVAIDWFLDRFRTAVNVLGDSYGAGIIEHLSRHDMDNFTAEEE